MYMINVGCGQTPTKGYKNFDNSLSLYFSKYAGIARLLYKIRLIEKAQYEFIQFCQHNSIEHADATKKLPLPDGSDKVLYSSHMIEHLDTQGVANFLDEAKRVLCKGGIIRLCVPDLRLQVEQYIQSNDADKFILDTGLAYHDQRTIVQRVRELVVGNRKHLWMYDADSLTRLLHSRGFINPVTLKPGETMISNPCNLDLYERQFQSVYVEAKNP